MTGQDPGIFQNILDATKGKYSNFLGGIESVLQPGPQPAGINLAGMSGQAGQNFGKGLMAMARPGNAALAGGTAALAGSLMQGDGLAETGGSVIGGSAASALAAKATPKLLTMGPGGWLAAAGLNVAAPLIGSVIGEKTAGGVANALAGPAQAATQTAGTQLNPFSTPNVADSSAADILAQAKAIQDSLGAQAANVFLQQKGMMSALGDLDERRARTAMMVAPVRTAGRLAEIGAGGAANLYMTGLQGTNQALSNITASNPYAQMLS